MGSSGGRAVGSRGWVAIAGCVFGGMASLGAASAARVFAHTEPVVIVASAAIAGATVGAGVWWRAVEARSESGYVRGVLAGAVATVLLYPATWALVVLWPVVGVLPGPGGVTAGSVVGTLGVHGFLAVVSLAVTGPVLVPVGAAAGASLVAAKRQIAVD